MGLFGKKDGKSIEIKVFDMTCGHCEMHVKKALESLPGVKSAKASKAKENAIVTFEKDKELPVDDLLKAVNETGYRAESL